MIDLSPEAVAPAPLGIVCPAEGCGCLLDQVLFTRKASNQILRVRKCPNPKCRRRIRTSERVVCTNSPGRAEKPTPAA